MLEATELTDDSLPGFLSQCGFGYVLCGSHMCRPTLAQARAFGDFFSRLRNKLPLGFVDALCHPSALKRYAVRLLPTILVVRNGRVTDTLEGFHSPEQLEAALGERVELKPAA
jgi:hypothetical protein